MEKSQKKSEKKIKKYYSRNKFAKMINFIENNQPKHPNDWDYLYGFALIGQKKIKKLEEHVAKFPKDSNKPSVLILKAESALLKNEFELSRKLFKKSIKRDSSNLDAKLGRVKILISRRQLDKALDQLNELIEQTDPNQRSSVLKADVLLQQKKYKECKKWLRQLLGEDQKNLNGLYIKVELSLAKFNFKRALKLVKKIRRISANDTFANCVERHIANVFFDCDQIQIGPIEDFFYEEVFFNMKYFQLVFGFPFCRFLPKVEHLMTEYANNAMLEFIKGRIKRSQGLFLEALDCFEKAIFLDKYPDEFYTQIVGLLLQMGKVDLANEFSETGLRINSYNDSLLVLKAQIKMQQDRKSIKFLKKQVKLFPFNPKLMSLLVQEHLQKGRIAKIKGLIEKYNKKIPKSQKTCYEFQMSYSSARSEYKTKILKSYLFENPENLDLLQIMAKTAYRDNHLQVAISSCSAILEKNRSQIEALTLGAKCYFDLGEAHYEQSFDMISRAIDLCPAQAVHLPMKLSLGRYFLSELLFYKTSKLLKNCLCGSPWHRESVLLKFDFLLQNKKPDEAIELLNALIEKTEPDNSLILLKTKFFWKQKKYQLCLDSAKELLKAEPENPEFVFYRAASLVELGLFIEAIPILEKLLVESPRHLEGHKMLIRCFQNEKFYKRKLGLLETMVEHFPENLEFVKQKSNYRLQLIEDQIDLRKKEEVALSAKEIEQKYGKKMARKISKFLTEFDLKCKRNFSFNPKTKKLVNIFEKQIKKVFQILFWETPEKSKKEKKQTFKRICKFAFKKIERIYKLYLNSGKSNEPVNIKNIRNKFLDRVKFLDQIFFETKFFGREHFEQELFSVEGLVPYQIYDKLSLNSNKANLDIQLLHWLDMINPIQLQKSVNPNFKFFTSFEIYIKYWHMFGDEIFYYFFMIFEKTVQKELFREIIDKSDSLLYQQKVYDFMVRLIPSNSKYQLDPLTIDVDNYLSCILFESIRTFANVAILINKPSPEEIAEKIFQQMLLIPRQSHVLIKIEAKSPPETVPFKGKLYLSSIQYINSSETANNFLVSVLINIASMGEMYLDIYDNCTEQIAVSYGILDDLKYFEVQIETEDQLFRMNKRRAFFDVNYIRRKSNFDCPLFLDVDVYQIQQDLNLKVGILKVIIQKAED